MSATYYLFVYFSPQKTVLIYYQQKKRKSAIRNYWNKPKKSAMANNMMEGAEIRKVQKRRKMKGCRDATVISIPFSKQTNRLLYGLVRWVGVLQCYIRLTCWWWVLVGGIQTTSFFRCGIIDAVKMELGEAETGKQFISREFIVPIANVGSPLMSFFGNRVCQCTAKRAC